MQLRHRGSTKSFDAFLFLERRAHYWSPFELNHTDTSWWLRYIPPLACFKEAWTSPMLSALLFVIDRARQNPPLNFRRFCRALPIEAGAYFPALRRKPAFEGKGEISQAQNEIWHLIRAPPSVNPEATYLGILGGDPMRKNKFNNIFKKFFSYLESLLQVYPLCLDVEDKGRGVRA